LQQQEFLNGHVRKDALPAASTPDGGRSQRSAILDHTARPSDSVAVEAALPSIADGLNTSNLPTNIAFDAFSQSRQRRRTSAVVPDVYQRAQLSAEAARQRKFSPMATGFN
jgi:hypothetical protein